jgi:hypothetical protein
MQEEQQLYMECLLPIWEKEILISVRLLKDYSNEAHQSAIAFAIEFSKTHQEQEEQFDQLGSESEDDDYGEIINPTKIKTFSNNFYKRFLSVHPFTGQIKC